MEKIVYFIHAVDTEGPLYESINETFKMINGIFGFNIEATKENLYKLQKKEIALNGKEDAVYEFVKPERMCYKKNWAEIEEMLERITKKEFRDKYCDSYGNGWIYSWFTMDHVGFNGINPRYRTYGYHNIFDYYKEHYVDKQNNDDLQFHYHPLSLLKNANACGTSFINSMNIFDILARKIIDRNWFPSVYRPGFHTERPDSNWFLEQWIPFDYGNQSIIEDESQPDLSKGRFGDWRKAPTNWGIYHPSHDDYRVEGNCRRWIARCLNIETRMRNITISELREAFKKAENTGKSIVSITNHDFREMSYDIEKVYNMLKEVSYEFKNVKFKYMKARDGIREYAGLTKVMPNLNFSIIEKNNITEIHVVSDGNVFGPQPFLAIKTHEGNYYWDNFDFFDKNHWTYTFDGTNTFNIRVVEKIGVAANSSYGITEVLNYNTEKKELLKNIINT